MIKAVTLGIATFLFVGIVGFANAQTATPTTSPTPTTTTNTTTTVPAGAPSTGFGR